MRVISQSELLRATKIDLQVLLREITASLPPLATASMTQSGSLRRSPTGRTANLNIVFPITTASPSFKVCRVMRRPFTNTPLVLLRSSMMV